MDLFGNLWYYGGKGDLNMGKFDGILLCTDLDDTLLQSDKSVSEENLRAIEYFKSEGGLFTFVTGRVPLGAKPVLRQVAPNAPAVCFNGGVIYDFEEKRTLWSRTLPDSVLKAAEYIDNKLPYAGIEVCTAEKVYFCKVNNVVLEHQRLEEFPDNFVSYTAIPEKWSKVLFMVESEKMAELRETVDNAPFAADFSFVQSSPWYYELLPKGANKGSGLGKLSEILDVPLTRVIACGDNENDLEMIKAAGCGVAVENAVDIVKDAADYITVGNNDNAIAAVIADLGNGKLL